MRSSGTIYFFVVLVLSVVLLCFAFRAGAVNEQWKYIAANENGSRFFYDSSSIMPISNDVVHVWVKNLGHDGSVTRILEEVNCSYKIVREQQVISERRGKSAPLPRPGLRWKAMERDPVMKELYKALCK